MITKLLNESWNYIPNKNYEHRMSIQWIFIQNSSTFAFSLIECQQTHICNMDSPFLGSLQFYSWDDPIFSVYFSLIYECHTRA